MPLQAFRLPDMTSLPPLSGGGITILFTVIFGLLVYIIPTYLTERDKVGPYPLWMHTFYCAADFMGIWVFLDLWINYNHYPLFILLSIGEMIWVLMEIFCLSRALTYEKDINWKEGTSFESHITDIIVPEKVRPKELTIK